MSEQQLIHALQQGYTTAFNHLIQQYKNQVFGVCMGFVHNRHEADDLTQEVFIKVWQTIASFRGEAQISTWLYRLAVNASLNHLRSKKRKAWLTRLQADDNSQEYQLPEATQADDTLHQQAIKQALQSALNKLPENQRTAFVLHKYQDMPYQQIAEVMATSLSSVESLMHRAKRNLQKHLHTFYKENFN